MTDPGIPTPAAPVIAQIGEIQVTSAAVRTPAGEFPLRGTTWQVGEQWLPEQKTPTWAIVVTVLGFFVVGPFSLLFLLVRTTVYRGVVQVTVNSWAHQYVARLVVTDQSQVQQIQQQVNYVRSLAAL
jgi:hypothetical protein